MHFEVVRTAEGFRKACDAVRARSQTLGLVPTMGALHEGHRSLMREAKRRADCVAVTIFVNPTQFGPREDLGRYPRDLEGDLQKCGAESVSLVFAPDTSEMYLPGDATRVRVMELADALCGASRPGHFEGVATVVTKLFALAGPSVAVFGRKDYQQFKVIERLARDLMLPVQVIGHPTVREPDGLALSSRNVYLSKEERGRALSIPRALSEAVARFAAGERNAGEFKSRIERRLTVAGLEVDYVALADAERLAPYMAGAGVAERTLLAVAAFCGSTRLIDNVVLGEDRPPIEA